MLHLAKPVNETNGADHSAFDPCGWDVDCNLCFNNLLDNENRIVWMLVPKVAATSIRQAIGQLSPVDKKRWSWASPVKTRNLVSDGCWLTIGFCRNPFTRLLSCWTNKGTGYRTWPLYGLHRVKNYHQFLKTTLDVEPFFADKHWRPISHDYSIILGYGREPTYLLRFEEMDKHWRWLSQQLPFLPPVLPRLNVSKSVGVEPLRKKDVDLVVGYYIDDFEMFGYPRVPPGGR